MGTAGIFLTGALLAAMFSRDVPERRDTMKPTCSQTLRATGKWLGDSPSYDVIVIEQSDTLASAPSDADLDYSSVD